MVFERRETKYFILKLVHSLSSSFFALIYHGFVIRDNKNSENHLINVQQLLGFNYL